MRTYFITGSDTGIGKTYVGCLLVKALIRNDVSLCVKKPIESGCRKQNGTLIAEDVSAYQAALANNTAVEEINRYRYEPAISPERAIRLNGDRITTKDLLKACKPDHDCEVLLVEGAGGFYSPLCSDGLNADLAAKLTENVLLVVADRLGCINQTLLCMEAIQQRGLQCEAIVLNQHRSNREEKIDNLEDLKQFVNVPVLPIPHESDSSSDALEVRRESIQMLVDAVKNSIEKK